MRFTDLLSLETIEQRIRLINVSLDVVFGKLFQFPERISTFINHNVADWD